MPEYSRLTDAEIVRVVNATLKANTPPLPPPPQQSDTFKELMDVKFESVFARIQSVEVNLADGFKSVNKQLEKLSSNLDAETKTSQDHGIRIHDIERLEQSALCPVHSTRLTQLENRLSFHDDELKKAKNYGKVLGWVTTVVFVGIAWIATTAVNVRSLFNLGGKVGP